MSSLKTADGAYEYCQTFHGLSLEVWGDLCHSALCLASGWRYMKLKPGGFGFDNMIHSIAALFERFPDVDGEEDFMADAVHDGWSRNYTYWRDNSPWKGNKLFKRPGKKLGDSRRDSCAMTSYFDLPEEEQVKDMVIVKTISDLLSC